MNGRARWPPGTASGLWPWPRATLRNRFLDRQRHTLRLSPLRDAFLALPEDQREALAMIAVEGLSHVKACQLLGIPPGTGMSGTPASLPSRSSEYAMRKDDPQIAPQT